MSTELQSVQAKIHRIPGASIEEVADALLTLAGMAQRIKELQADADAAILERIKESGEFAIGDTLYTLAKPKKVKCRDVAVTTGKLLEITGGDLDKINGCLAAGAWKHGAVKRVLEECGAPGETFDQLFETSYEEEVKPVKVNLAFAGK